MNRSEYTLFDYAFTKVTALSNGFIKHVQTNNTEGKWYRTFICCNGD